MWCQGSFALLRCFMVIFFIVNDSVIGTPRPEIYFQFLYLSVFYGDIFIVNDSVIGKPRQEEKVGQPEMLLWFLIMCALDQFLLKNFCWNFFVDKLLLTIFWQNILSKFIFWKQATTSFLYILRALQFTRARNSAPMWYLKL